MDYSNIPSNNPQSSDYKQENAQPQVQNRPRQTAKFKLAEPKKKSKFAQIFLNAGDINKAKEYVKNETVPSLKYFLFTNFVRMIESYFFKDVRYGKTQGGGRPIDYAKISSCDYSGSGKKQQQPVSTAMHFDFSDIIFETRADAADCLYQMNEIIEQYNYVSVGDLLDLVSRTPNQTDWTYVWSDLSTASTREVMGGCILLLPEPRPLNLAQRG